MADLASLVIRGATRVEAGQPRREVDVVIEDGILTELNVLHWGSRRTALGAVHDPSHTRSRTQVIDGTGLYLAPGFLDLHTHLRDPGQPEKETIGTGAAAAAAGGFTSIVAMANTMPPVDNPTVLRGVLDRSYGEAVRVSSVASVTKGLDGKQLTDMEALAKAGAVAFSDDGRNGYSLELAIEAGRRAAALDRAILVHAQDEAICRDGQVNASIAEASGLEPWPCEAEVSAVKRAIDACRESGARLHLQHLSCSGSIELLERARDEGLPVTAEVTPHHLVLTDQHVMAGGDEPDAMAKVNPPLRSDRDRADLVAALRTGLIDAIATDHAPHDIASKGGKFERASFGFSGLETALSLCLELVDSGALNLDRLVEALTLGPWRCLSPGLDQAEPALRVGAPADLVLFETKGLLRLDPARLESKGKNTPVAGRDLRGRVLLTVARGQIVHGDWFAVSS